MKRQHNYRIYPTILDAYWNYLNSDVIYDKYWGNSQNPALTPEEFQEKQFQSLIDSINRKPFDSEAADRGTAFNELIDCMVEHRRSPMMEIEEVYGGETEEVTAVKTTYNNREFTFPIGLCREFADYFNGAVTQLRVEADLPTAYGKVLVYGVIDELMPMSVHDIKTTGSYSVGKFKANHQHLVYPYALMMNGSNVRLFEYNVAELNKNGFPTGTYTETYVFEPERDIPVLRNHCEEFIRFLEENKALITNERIFG